MKEYQQRVIKELDELKDKITKLGVFICTITYAELEIIEQHLLRRQQRTMIEYARILNERIELFK